MLGRGCRSTCLAGCLCCQLQQAGRQALDIFRLVEGQRKCLCGIKDMIAKRRAEPGQFLLDLIKTLALLALQAHSGQFSVADERIDDALLRRVIRRPCRTCLERCETLIDCRALPQAHGKLHHVWLHGLVCLPQFFAILDTHEVPNNTPGYTETVRKPFERLHQPFPGRLGLRLKLLQCSCELR
jgi:hypothetical protein